MAGIIMTCSSLRRHVDAAQKKENTAYEVYELDSRLHAEPKEMRAAVFEAMENLPGASGHGAFVHGSLRRFRVRETVAGKSGHAQGR